MGTRPRCLAIRPPTLSTSSSSTSKPNSSWRSSTGKREETRAEPSSRTSTSISSSSNSSVISPTISSRRSSIVISPAVPPYSSTTDGDVLAIGLHLREQGVDRLGVGHEVGRAHHLFHPLGELHVGRLEVAAHEVLEVGEAEDVVEVLADDRHPGEAAAQEQRHRLAQVLVVLDVDHVRARHHHLAGDGVAELEDRVDHLPLPRLDHRRRLGEVDELAQLGLGGERALAEAAAGGDRVADQDQQPRERAEDGGDDVERRRGGERDAFRVLAAQGARGDPDHHEGDDQHDRDRGGGGGPERTAPGVADQLGDDHRRRDLAEQPEEERGVEVADRVGQQDRQPARSGPPLGQHLVGARPGGGRQGGVGRREEPGEDDQGGGRDDQPHVGRAHRGSTARHSASSRSCRPNISACSSGSAWS